MWQTVLQLSYLSSFTAYSFMSAGGHIDIRRGNEECFLPQSICVPLQRTGDWLLSTCVHFGCEHSSNLSSSVFCLTTELSSLSLLMEPSFLSASIEKKTAMQSKGGVGV